VDHLVRDGHDVVVVDPARGWRNPAADYRQADLFDQPDLAEALAGVQAVFHLAGAADVNAVAADPVRAVQLNVEGTARVLEAARQGGVDRVVLASTVWVYGATVGQGERTEAAPVDLSRAGHVYVATKLAAEMMVHSYHEMFGQQFTILRYGIPYGPRMRDALVVARFVQAAQQGQPITSRAPASSSAITSTSRTWPTPTSAPWPRPRRARPWPWRAARRSRSGRSPTRYAAWSGRSGSSTCRPGPPTTRASRCPAGWPRSCWTGRR
jgi:dTDP-4-dehydrorhamnose reductase